MKKCYNDVMANIEATGVDIVSGQPKPIIGGDTLTVPTGTLTVAGGSATTPTSIGGTLTITGGAGGTTSGAGGTVTVQGGLATSGAGGAITLNGRNGVGGSSDGGNTTITSGTAEGAGAGGIIQISSGTSPSGTSGTIRFSTGTTGAVAERARFAATGGTLLLGDGTLATAFGGTGNTAIPLILYSDNTSGTQQFISSFNTTAASGSSFVLSRARGTPAAPVTVSAGDSLGGVFFSGASSATTVNYVGQIAGEASTTGATAGFIRFFTSTASALVERARIADAGTLELGDGTAAAAIVGPGGFASQSLTSYRNSSNNAGFYSFSATADAGNIFNLARGRGTAAAPTIVASGDSIGVMQFIGFASAASTGVAASISSEIDGTPGLSDMPGRLILSTTLDGTATPVERMRINNIGTIFVGNGTLTSGFGGAGAATTSLHAYRNSTTSIRVASFTAASAIDSSYLILERARGTAASPAAVTSGDVIGGISFQGATTTTDGRTFVDIVCEADGIVGGLNDAPGRLRILTTPDGSGTPIERMRINNAGIVTIGNGESSVAPNAAIVQGTQFSGAGTGASLTIAGGPGGTTSGTGGELILSGGAAAAGASAGGATTVDTGWGSTSGNSGVLTIRTGQPGTTGASGAITITTRNGGSSSGNSGGITIRTGTVVSGTVGTVSLGVGGVNNWTITATGNLEKQVLGGYILTERVVTARTTNLSVPTAASRTTYSNEGAGGTVVFTLPTASAGLEYEFYVLAAQTLNVTANTGDTIRLGASVSASAGNITNAIIGGYVRLVALNATEWIASAPVGVWTVT